MKLKSLIFIFSMLLVTTGVMAQRYNNKDESSLSSYPNETYNVNGVAFTMVYVEGGTFFMGCSKADVSDEDDEEAPEHQVTVSSFSIGKYEVTQELWEAVMGVNPSHFVFESDTKILPVEQVSWDDCQEFIHKLNALTGKKFRLPTEAEWEYAARGGNKSKHYKYAGSKKPKVGWHHRNSKNTTHPVGMKKPNELGLYDMSGNVCEWCEDWYDSDYYKYSPQNNPCNTISSPYRIFRGGAWGTTARCSRVFHRMANTPSSHSFLVGLRLAL